MLALIKKDIILQRRALLIGILYIFLMSFVFSDSGNMGAVVALFVVTFLYIQTPCAYDSQNNADMLLNSLPVKRSTIVIAKYLTVPLYFLLSVVEYSVLSLLLSLLRLPIALEPLTWEAISGMTIAIAFFASVFHPINFRWGYLRTRYVNIVLMIAVLAATSSFPELMAGLGTYVPPTFLLPIAALALLAISCGLSVWLYRGREF